MRAPVFQSENSAVLGADKHNRLAGKTRGEGPSGFHLGGPGERIPMVGMRANFAEVKVGRRRGIALKHSSAPQRGYSRSCCGIPTAAKRKIQKHPSPSGAGSDAQATRL